MRPAVLIGPCLLPLLLALSPARTATPATAPAPAPAPAEPPPQAVHLPGGIADPAGRTGFLAAADGGLDAIDLATGHRLWRTSEAQRPLLVAGDRLYAQAGVRRNRLRVLAFDVTRGGECVLESDPVVFPAWVVTGEAAGRSFAARWRLEKSQLVLAWQARAWSGAPGGVPDLRLPIQKQAEGVARIDLETGTVETGPAEPPAPTPPVQAPRYLERMAVRWQGVVGRYFAALVFEEAPDEPEPSADEERERKDRPRTDRRPEATDRERDRQRGREETPRPRRPAVPSGVRRDYRLVLRFWDQATGTPGKERELLRGRRPVVLVTQDGRHLCVRDGLPSPDELMAAQAQRLETWKVFTPTGRKVATLPHVPGTEAVALLGARAYCLVAGPVRGPLDRPSVRPRTLQAFDLATGKKRWTYPVAGKALTPPGK